MESVSILVRLPVGDVEWIQLAQDRDMAGCSECRDEPPGPGATELLHSAR
jgi:hypothetical protein